MRKFLVRRFVSVFDLKAFLLDVLLFVVGLGQQDDPSRVVAFLCLIKEMDDAIPLLVISLGQTGRQNYPPFPPPAT